MGDSSIIQVFQIVDDGLANGWKNVEFPRENKTGDRNSGTNSFKKIELSPKHLAIHNIKLESKSIQCHKTFPKIKLFYHNIRFSVNFR